MVWPASGWKQVGFVFLDANLIDARDGGPEVNEVVDFAGISSMRTICATT